MAAERQQKDQERPLSHEKSALRAVVSMICSGRLYEVAIDQREGQVLLHSSPTQVVRVGQELAGSTRLAFLSSARLQVIGNGKSLLGTVHSPK